MKNAGPRREMSAKLCLLKPGTYEMKLSHAGPDGIACVDRQEIEVERAGSQISFQLPAQISCELSLLMRP